MNSLNILLVAVIVLLILPQFVFAEVEWTLKKQLTVEAAPLDTALSTDGQTAYILTPGEITVYSIAEDKVLSKIPVDKSFDRISNSSQANANTLMLSSSTTKTIRLISVEVLQKFDLSGLAFKGPESAPVTIAIFSDYQ